MATVQEAFNTDLVLVHRDEVGWTEVKQDSSAEWVRQCCTSDIVQNPAKYRWVPREVWEGYAVAEAAWRHFYGKVEKCDSPTLEVASPGSGR